MRSAEAVTSENQAVPEEPQPQTSSAILPKNTRSRQAPSEKSATNRTTSKRSQSKQSQNAGATCEQNHLPSGTLVSFGAVIIASNTPGQQMSAEFKWSAMGSKEPQKYIVDYASYVHIGGSRVAISGGIKQQTQNKVIGIISFRVFPSNFVAIF